MTIWQLMEYFVVVSIVALFLLVMKRLFHDKLDARWHYLIWIVLGVRMVVPVSLDWLKSPLSLFEAIPVNYWVKVLEYKAKRAGVLSNVQSLLWVYVAGVIVFGGYYLLVALWARFRILRLEPADEAVCIRVEEIADRYALKSCKSIRVGKEIMPCVSGLFSPILVLPKEEVEEEVLVHELLHKKYGDVWINYTLHLVRVLNWFNPLIWYVTAVILNDSEALCDQRVLECMEKQRTEKAQPAIEKVYGSLLLNMANHKQYHNTRIGTTNMANSYRNMHTRIKRIADFRRVPEGVGFVALCITVVLSTSVISYCEESKIISCGVEDERDLERVMTRAMIYEAETKEEAIYLYLKAMKEMNPIYLLAVTPNAELPELEAWIWDMFEQDKFVRWVIGRKSYIGNSQKATYYSAAEWLNFQTDIIENPWYVWDGSSMLEGWIYNAQGDEKSGSAAVELYVYKDGAHAYVNWDLELLYEDGWKVKRVGEEVFHKSQWMEEPQPMLRTEEIGEEWKVIATGYNEAKFYSLFDTYSGWRVYDGDIPTMEEYEKSAEYPEQFNWSGKNQEICVVYQGEESLEGKSVHILAESYSEAKFNEKMKNGYSLAEMTSEDLKLQAIYDEKNYISSSGNRGRFLDGKVIKKGEEIEFTNSVSGSDVWEYGENMHFIVWIYYDGECVEVIKE